MKDLATTIGMLMFGAIACSPSPGNSSDSGGTGDGGSKPVDAGKPRLDGGAIDGGSDATDAGVPLDAGVPTSDAGGPNADAGSEGSDGGGDAGGFIDPVSGFAHPGVFNSHTELVKLAARIASQDPAYPNYAALVRMMADPHASLSYAPTPHFTVSRSATTATNTNSAVERDDAQAAYTQAIIWATTGDVRYAESAIAIMNAWAAVFDHATGDVNRYLDASWSVPHWAGAGELLRWARPGGAVAAWSDAEVKAFQGFVGKREAESSQMVVQPFNPASNWGVSSVLSELSAGVFLDHRSMYTRGLVAMKRWMPDVVLAGGWTNEVFRDCWHGIASLPGIMEAAEVERHQGTTTIYELSFAGDTEPRLVHALAWYGAALLPGPGGMPQTVPIAPPVRGTAQFSCRGTSGHPGWEMARNYYAYVHPTPGLEPLTALVLTEYRGRNSGGTFFAAGDTVTHGDLDKL